MNQTDYKYAKQGLYYCQKLYEATTPNHYRYCNVKPQNRPNNCKGCPHTRGD